MPLWTETCSLAGGVLQCPGTESLMARRGEEQSWGQQGTLWMLQQPRFCQSCVGEVSVGSFALGSFPPGGLGAADVMDPPQGLYPCTTSSGPVHTLAPGLPGTRTKPEPMEPQLEESAFSSHLWQPLTSPHRLCLLSEPRPGPVRIRLSVDPQGIISATPLLVQWALQTPRPEHPAASGVIR